MKDDKLYNVFRTIEMLARPNGATPREVSDALGFDRHTFYSMLKTLDAINIPYDKKSDIDGPTNSMRYFVREEFLSSAGPKLLRMSPSEFFVLKYLLRKDSLLKDSSMSSVVESLQQKLARLTFSDTKGSAPAIYVTDNHRRHYDSVRQEIFSRIIEAIEKRTVINVTYTSAPDMYNKRETKSYELEPYTFLDHNGAFYVLAKKPEYEEVRTFSLDRFSAVELMTGKYFDLPPNFSPAKYLEGAFGIYNGGESVRVKLRFVWHTWTAIADRTWGIDQKFERCEDGSFLLEFTSTEGFELVSWILSFGDGVEVLAPESLRNDIRDRIQNASAKYAS